MRTVINCSSLSSQALALVSGVSYLSEGAAMLLQYLDGVGEAWDPVVFLVTGRLALAQIAAKGSDAK